MTNFKSSIQNNYLLICTKVKKASSRETRVNEKRRIHNVNFLKLFSTSILIGGHWGWTNKLIAINKITEKKKRKMTEITAERRLTRSDQTPVLQRLVNAIRIKHYPADSDLFCQHGSTGHPFIRWLALITLWTRRGRWNRTYWQYTPEEIEKSHNKDDNHQRCCNANTNSQPSS